MRSWDQSFPSSSPVLVLPPTHPPFDMDHSRPIFTSPFANGNNSVLPPAPSNLTPSASAAAGRKRSRDEAAPNLEEDYFAVQPPIPEKEPENEEEWEYGEGMTLIKPNAGYIMEAASQSGTFAEEKAEEERSRANTPSTERPILRAAKSQRLNLASTPTIAEETSVAGTVTAPSPERSNNLEPTVDEFTRHLGIGWSSISADVDIQAAVRGWTKFIENHFPVTDAKIRLQSRGLSSYLVEANEGFFLFADDLKKGQLVSTSLDRTWANLSSPIPIFDGAVVLEAVATPTVGNSTPVSSTGLPATNGTLSLPHTSEPVIQNGVAPSHTMEVEMDMS